MFSSKCHTHRTDSPRTRVSSCVPRTVFAYHFFKRWRLNRRAFGQEMEGVVFCVVTLGVSSDVYVTFLQPHSFFHPCVYQRLSDVFWVVLSCSFPRVFWSIKKLSHKSIVREPAKKPEAIQEWNMVQANLRCLVETIAASEFSGRFIVGY